MQYQEITKKIIGAAMNVHNTLGYGFQETIYQRALALEYKEKGLLFKREYEMQIFYNDMPLGTRRVDFFIEGIIMVEVKALKELNNSHLVQIKNYLEIYKLEIGILLNFGTKRLEFKRIHNNTLNNIN